MAALPGMGAMKKKKLRVRALILRNIV